MVCVLDQKKRPLMPCTPKRARILLARGRAVVHRVQPFVIRLKDRRVEDSVLQPIALKIDPGSKTTGMALARVEAAVTGSKLKNADLTEKMAFFEAYGALVGTKGIPALEKLLVAKGLLGRKEDPETRACAAMALGKIRTPEARAVLERASQDKEPLVRNAVARALREVGT